jgi:peptide/nickel transport system substrate-binding protein
MEDQNLPGENKATPATNNPQAQSPKEVVFSTDDNTSSLSPGPSQPGTEPSIFTVGGPKPSRFKKLMVGFTVLVLLVGAGAGWFIYNNSRNNSNVTVKKDISHLDIATFTILPTTFYPNSTLDSIEFGINMQAFEALTKFEDGTVLKPGLAESWTNPDTSTWVFKLKQNVKFHTGKTMTASDVKASLEGIKSTDYGKTYASTIKTVEAVDSNTVKIITDGPDPILANELSSLFIYDSTSSKKDDPINGTGPYTLKSSTKDSIVLTAYDQYHGGHVYTRELAYKNYDEMSQLPSNTLQNHSAGLIFNANKDDSFDTKAQANGYKTLAFPTYAVSNLVFNTRKAGSPLANVTVRRAIAQAIDAKALIPIVDKKATPATQIVAKGIPGYNPSLQAPTYSVSDAQKALAAAGYPNGFSIKLTFFPVSYNTAAMNAIKEQLAKINVTVNLDPENDQNTIYDIDFNGKTDMYYITSSSNYVDASDILADFTDSANYQSNQFDTLNAQAGKEINSAKRVAILQQMSKVVHDDQAYMALYQRSATIYEGLSNLVIKQDTVAAEPGTYFWQVYSNKK